MRDWSRITAHRRCGNPLPSLRILLRGSAFEDIIFSPPQSDWMRVLCSEVDGGVKYWHGRRSEQGALLCLHHSHQTRMSECPTTQLSLRIRSLLNREEYAEAERSVEVLKRMPSIPGLKDFVLTFQIQIALGRKQWDKALKLTDERDVLPVGDKNPLISSMGLRISALSGKGTLTPACLDELAKTADSFRKAQSLIPIPSFFHLAHAADLRELARGASLLNDLDRAIELFEDARKELGQIDTETIPAGRRGIITLETALLEEGAEYRIKRSADANDIIQAFELRKYLVAIARKDIDEWGLAVSLAHLCDSYIRFKDCYHAFEAIDESLTIRARLFGVKDERYTRMEASFLGPVAELLTSGGNCWFEVHKTQMRICFVCQKIMPKMSKCASCGLSYYCGSACQNSDWKSHKKLCSKGVQEVCASLGLNAPPTPKGKLRKK